MVVNLNLTKLHLHSHFVIRNSSYTLKSDTTPSNQLSLPYARSEPFPAWPQRRELVTWYSQELRPMRRGLSDQPRRDPVNGLNVQCWERKSPPPQTSKPRRDPVNGLNVKCWERQSPRQSYQNNQPRRDPVNGLNVQCWERRSPPQTSKARRDPVNGLNVQCWERRSPPQTMKPRRDPVNGLNVLVWDLHAPKSHRSQHPHCKRKGNT